jgi:hypothetical protein
VAENASSQPETWVELKSWSAKSQSDRETFYNEAEYGTKVPWIVLGKSPTKADKKNDSMHKQYSLDRAAVNLKYAFLTKAETQDGSNYAVQTVDKFIWKFHKFKVMNGNQVKQISPKVGNGSKFFQLVKKRPDINLSSGDKNEFLNMSFGVDATHSPKVEVSGAADIVELLATYGFEELKDLVIDEPVD